MTPAALASDPDALADAAALVADCRRRGVELYATPAGRLRFVGPEAGRGPGPGRHLPGLRRPGRPEAAVLAVPRPRVLGLRAADRECLHRDVYRVRARPPREAGC